MPVNSEEFTASDPLGLPGKAADRTSAADRTIDADARIAIGRLRAGAWLLALVIFLGIPAIRAFYGAQASLALLAEEAQQASEALSARASARPDDWVFETNAIQRTLSDSLADRWITAARVVDAKGQTVLSLGPWSAHALFERQDEILDSGLAVATLHTQQDAGPLLGSVAQTALLSLLLGLATYVLVARLAVGSIVRTVSKLQDALREAQRAGDARTVFLATMSHEIRTPMNGVIGMTSLLRDTPLDEQQRHYVDVIRGSGESLLRVINDILEFSKVESGHGTLEPQAFQPDVLGEEVLMLLEPLSRHKEVKLAFEAGQGVPAWVLADVNRLRQVLVNLVGNAIKFSEHGTVLLRLQCPAPGRLLYVLSDQGIGMTPEQIRIVFDPFVQADASTSRRFGGTGLGLAISRRLAEMMGGSIAVASEPGVGSTFSLEIAAAQIEAPERGGDAVDAAFLVGKRALLVDDSPVNLEIVDTLARGWGMRTVPMTDPQRALTLAADRLEHLDVAILDFNMPHLDGHALGRRLRELRPDLALVLLSSANGAAHDPGLFDTRLNKPVLRNLLRDSLRSVLSKTAVQAPDQLTHSAIVGLRDVIGLPPVAGLHVLVVEDNPINAMVIGAMLERLGVRNERVSNGLEAVQAIERQRYDLVLMDMLMPEMDGLEATRRVRANRSLVQPRIVALTANVMSEDRANCSEAGMDDFLSKPLQLGELERCLNAHAAVLARQAAEARPR